MERISRRVNELSVWVRSEQGRAQIDVGLDALLPEERAFLFDVIQRTQRGGDVGFSLEPDGEGGMLLKLQLNFVKQHQKPIDKAVEKGLNAP